MSLIDEHNRAYAAAGDGDGSRSSTSSNNPFSLDGWEEGTAADLIEIGQTINALRDTEGRVIKDV